jgi:hypothetical protein
MTPDQIVNHVVSNSRLEGVNLDDETIAVVRKVASHEMSKEEALQWKKKRVATIKARARKVSVA